jgi:hypothetical protein
MTTTTPPPETTDHADEWDRAWADLEALYRRAFPQIDDLLRLAGPKLAFIVRETWDEETDAPLRPLVAALQPEEVLVLLARYRFCDGHFVPRATEVLAGGDVLVVVESFESMTLFVFDPAALDHLRDLH